MKKLFSFLIGIALTLLLIEIIVRVAGLTDVPIYNRDDDLRYVVAPSQTGAFMRTHDWAFNERSMGVKAPWSPTPGKDLLLIGNSIIMGGNAYAQADHLGPLLQQELAGQYNVWPMATNGWSTVNETAFMERNLDVAGAADFFVWEIMPGAFLQLSGYPGEAVFPHTRPTYATWYFLRHYVLLRYFKTHTTDPPKMTDVAENERRFEAVVATMANHSSRPVHGIFLLYTAAKEFNSSKHHQEWLPERPIIERIASKYNVRVIDLSTDPEWSETVYRDRTHPTVEGNRLLAKWVARAVREAASAESVAAAGSAP